MQVLITGVSGFVGSHAAMRLQDKHTVRGLVRTARARGHLPPQAKVELVVGDITTPATLGAAVDGMDAVIHTVAIPYEHGGATFHDINVMGTRNVVAAAQAAGVKRFVHLSALAADSNSPYPYLKSKGEGEAAVRSSNLEWTILTPSVLVGPEDEFANALARWLVITPLAFPLVGDGQTRFQPLWVEDLATILLKTLDDPTTIRKGYELGGPEHLTYEAMVRQILAALHRKRVLLKIPVPLMRPVIKLMEVALPKPPATTGLLDLLNVDNSTALDAVPRAFGFTPRRFAEVIPYMNTLSFRRALREAFSSRQA